MKYATIRSWPFRTVILMRSLQLGRSTQVLGKCHRGYYSNWGRDSGKAIMSSLKQPFRSCTRPMLLVLILSITRGCYTIAMRSGGLLMFIVGTVWLSIVVASTAYRQE